MTRFCIVAVVTLVALGSTTGQCADLIPTPEFSDHPIPTTSVPHADSQAWAVLDVFALIGALCLATYFAHVSRSRRHLLTLTVACVLWFGFVRGGCVCAIGATQNVALALFDTSYVIPLTVVIFFTLPLVFTLFFGRTFCAAVCPLGAVQELVSVRSVRVPTWLDQALGMLAYIYLGAAILLAGTNTAFIICRYDPFVAMFRLSGSAPMLIFGGAMLLVGVFVGRPYCRFLCPYGAILRVLSRFSKWHVRIPPSTCINCRLCEDACPYDAINTPKASQSPEQRASGKQRLMVMLILAPLLLAGGAWLGGRLGEPLASWHPDVQLAEQLRREELGIAHDTTNATDAFRSASRSSQELYAVALQRRDDYGWLGTWLGAWVGLVIAAKLIQLSLDRRRIEFTPDRSGCVACGRCFWYCPLEQVRQGQIVDVSELVPEAKV